MTTKQKIIIRASSVVALAVIFCIIYLFRNFAEENAYKALEASNDIDAYANFVEKYPNSTHYYEVHEKYLEMKEELSDWEEVAKSTNIADLEHFISAHEESTFAKIAKQRLDSILWGVASKSGNLEDYVDYLTRVPDGKHVEEANKIAYNMRQHLLTAEESQSASAVVSRFLAAIDSKSSEDMLQNVDSNISFFGKKTGKAYILSWLEAIYSEDVYNLSITVNDTQVEKKVGENENITYVVRFEIDMYFSRYSDSQKPTYYNKKGVATLNKDYKIISFNWQNISSK